MVSTVELVVTFVTSVSVLTVQASSASDAIESSPPVFVVTLDSIHRVTPPARPDFIDKSSTLSYGRGYVNTIDFNYANKTFCYIHPTRLVTSEFVCASADNFTQSWVQLSPTLFPSQLTVTVMMRDWVSGAWYFADKHRCLYVCDDSLQDCRVLQNDVEEPLGLAVDPTALAVDGHTAGYLFWSQNNTNPSRLMRSSLAGDDVTGLLPKDCSGPCAPKALTLDIASKLIFWIDGDEVAVSNYDGSSRRSVYRIPEAYNRDIRVFTVFKSTIYTPGYRSLVTAELNLKNSAEPNTTETYTNVNGFPSTALVYHGSRQPPVSHPCMKNKGGCQHICVTAYRDATPIARCLCRHGFQLDDKKHGACNRIQLDSFLLMSRGRPPIVELRAPGLQGPAAPVASNRPTVADVDTSTGFIYFSDTYVNKIIRQKLDGTERTIFIKDGIYECQGLAVDWMGGKLYWTDEPLGRVNVVSVSDPTQRRELIKQSSYHPYSIVLDPQRGVMYWSAWARGPTSASIETAYMDGSSRRTLASAEMEWPNGLTLDMDKQVLYWCDTKQNKIESLELATNKRSIILAAPEADIKEPYGLVLVEGGIMWSEQNTGRLRLLSTDGNVTTVDTVGSPLYDIRMVSKSSRIGSNACSSNNGGCTELCLATPGGRACAGAEYTPK